MTDKPIIIDGVDVSGCKYFDCCNKECKAEYYIMHGYEIVKYDSCIDNPNCYYKQLIRKERECQQAMDNYVQLDLQRVKEYNELVDLYKAKEQECEELKEELQAQRAFTAHEQKLIYCVAYDETCKTDNDCKQEKCIFKDNIKFKQTLAEIKEICNEYQKEYILNIGVEILTNKILQII